MIKKKCLFIDHKYHATTNSSKFFTEILSSEYEIEVLFLEDFSDTTLQQILCIKTDLYLIWQYDFLAPFFLSHGKKVIIVPMYDGTGEMPPLHWLPMKGGLFINFSQVLHGLHTSLGLSSLYCRYYPNPNNYPKFDQSISDANSLFFWERQPQSGFCVEWLSYQLSKSNFGVKQVHIHQSPDPGQYSKRHSSMIETIFSYKQVSVSNWFESRGEYLTTLAKFGIFIAPRKAEGIGFSFIDAMACGLIVCGHNKTTMNEYITHGQTGITFDNELPDFRSFDMGEIRNESMRSFVEGYESWSRFLPSLMSSIREYLSTPEESFLPPISPTLASQISNAFFWRQDIYISLLYELMIDLRGNEIWRTRLRPPKLSATLPLMFKNHPIFSQVLLEVFSKRKKII